jgi:hypothetical protein
LSGARLAGGADHLFHPGDGSSTIESQQRECRRYAREHGLIINEDAIYVDTPSRGPRQRSATGSRE